MTSNNPNEEQTASPKVAEIHEPEVVASIDHGSSTAPNSIYNQIKDLTVQALVESENGSPSPAKKHRKKINPLTCDLDDIDLEDLCDPDYWDDKSNFITPTAEEEEAFDKFIENYEEESARDAAIARQGLSKQDRSKRNPDMPKFEDLADQIDRALAEDGHKKWGWVLYRCTYESEEHWKEAVSSIQFHLRRSLESYNALDLLDSHELTVMDDRAAFDGANSMQLRQNFQQWAASAMVTEQGTNGPASGLLLAQRYRFFLRIDKEDLDSIMHVIRSGEGETVLANLLKPLGHMDLITVNHAPATSSEASDDREEELSDGGRAWRVGWARFHYKRYLEVYTMFRPYSSWIDTYTRPPNLLAH